LRPDEEDGTPLYSGEETMNIYLLSRIDEESIGWDEYIGFVIAANDEEQARSLASTYKYGDEGPQTWTDPSQSRCERVGSSDAPDAYVILESYRAA
jgi:hypothetical protein